MDITRRRLVGAMAVGVSALGLPHSITGERAAAQPLDLAASATGGNRFRDVLLPQVRAALDRHAASIVQRDVVGLVDFSAPSRAARFYLLDMGEGQVISTHLVAHGKGSDPANSGWVERLSNRPGSNASCDGAFRTGQTYFGEHGRSRRLIGLDPQNDMAEPRAIVIHGAPYVDPRLAVSQGRVGRSQGCFAVGRAEIDDLLELLGEGRLLFAAR
ncbi:murein L,D-transpeptidase catalytic domain family protein [Novosphingobium piscinae]|uniref:Murein L,D-transpeptidase catalytic domain family protein n=1 Tax=Novosphingobium piscinae TaxID=1507448 RepID=A0A7X1G049_9SPHN|nr:murein L,D-transpeptidase catalytic domain family protein [Novosphingobium piscinae]MBC2670165.1 murein L,D-transpeptidase catalytic domain family protein [Novosphingobium piscinae]